MKIGILQTGHSPEGLVADFGDYGEMFKNLLGGFDFDFQVYSVVDNEFPADIHQADGWLITGSRFGAYAPSVANNKLLYNDYTAHGMNVVVKSLTWDQEQKSQDSFVPVFEKFAAFEASGELEPEQLKMRTSPSLLIRSLKMPRIFTAGFCSLRLYHQA